MSSGWLFSILFFAALFCISNANATDQGHGRVTVNGSIIDTACTIDIGDKEQSVNLGVLSSSELLHTGHGPYVPIQIHLINCSLAGSNVSHSDHWSGVHITFDSAVKTGNFFKVEGTAHGGKISISDILGHLAIPGSPMPDMPIDPGSMTLNYIMRIEADHQRIRPGALHTTIRYFMDYD